MENGTEVLTLANAPYLLLYYDLTMRITATIVCLLILIIGVVGNVLVILVVLSSRSGMLTTTNCYLVSLSIADLLVLLTGNTSLITELNVIRDRWVIFGYFGCTAIIYTQYVGVNTSAMSITAFSIERFVAICYPIKAQMICTVKRAKRIIFCIWVFCAIYNSPWMFLTTIVQKPIAPNSSIYVDVCYFKLSRTDPRYMVFYIADLSLFYLVPLGLLSVLYILIARVLFKSSNASASCDVHGTNAKRTLKNRIQVVKMLFVVVVMFAVFWLPYRSMVVYNSFAPKERKIRSEWYILSTRILLFVNSAINPVIYNAMSVRFRREFSRLLSCFKIGASTSGPRAGANSMRSQSIKCKNGAINLQEATYIVRRQSSSDEDPKLEITLKDNDRFS